MMEQHHIYRAYDIRGIYPHEINEEFALKVGKAFGTFLNGGRVVVGFDCRKSSPSLKESLIQGLLSVGCDVVEIGMVHTPSVVFATAFYGYDGGVMITASHNPKEWNGFLFYGKGGVSISYEKGIDKIRRFIETESFRRATKEGKREEKEVLHEYYEFMLRKLQLENREKPFSGFKVVVDAGNGVAGKVAVPLLRELGCEVVELFCEPDGDFPNREPEPTKENLKTLSETVVSEKADLGMAYDGDGDRLFAVDENGRILDSPQLFAALIKACFEGVPEEKRLVVLDAIMPSVIEKFVASLRGRSIRCKVGHVFIQEKLLKEGAILAGEVSGHYSFSETFGADDAIYASLKLLKYLKEEGRSLSQVCEELPPYFFSTMRIETRERRKFEFIDELKEEFRRKGYKLDCLDGVKIIFPRGWVLVRASNTEPKVSVAYEGEDEKAFQELKGFVDELVRKL